MYYPCSENKGADQLRGYREADLRLCFSICKMPVFSRRGSYYKMHFLYLRCCMMILLNCEFFPVFQILIYFCYLLAAAKGR